MDQSDCRNHEMKNHKMRFTNTSDCRNHKMKNHEMRFTNTSDCRNYEMKNHEMKNFNMNFDGLSHIFKMIFKLSISNAQ